MDVRRARTDREREAALAVRREVFVDEQGVPEHLEVDGRDGESIHVVGYDGEQPVAAARLRPTGESTAKVERVAVVASRRGEGIGRAVMDAVESIADDEDYPELVLHAQVPVVAFYERLGYEVVGEAFEEAGIPHRKMRRRR